MNRSSLLEKLGQMLMSDSHYYKAVSLSRYAGEKWALGNYAESEETYINDPTEVPASNVMMTTHSTMRAVAEHAQSYIEMMYVVQGEFTHHICGEEVTLRKGDCIIIKPNVSHSIVACTVHDIACNFEFGSDYFNKEVKHGIIFNSLLVPFLHDDSIEKWMHCRSYGDESVLLTAENLISEFLDPDIASAVNIQSLFKLLFNAYYRVWRDKGGAIQLRSTASICDIQQILECIRLNYATVSLKELSRRFGYDPHYLSKLIKQYVGESFVEFKHRICIEQSKRMLEHCELPIAEISRRVGYNNTTYFYSLFRESCGVTPTQYRELRLSNQ